MPTSEYRWKVRWVDEDGDECIWGLPTKSAAELQANALRRQGREVTYVGKSDA